MDKPPRKKLPPAEQRAAENFYSSLHGRRHRCVITGNQRTWWHHLDDNPSHSVFENVIPLDPDLNKCLRDIASQVAKGAAPVLAPELRPEDLHSRAKIHANIWDHGPAYGCARLAFYVARQYLRYPVERLIPLASYASYCARHKLNYRLVEDILIRDVIPLLETADSISLSTLAIILQDAAATYGDQGEIDEASELYRILDTPHSQVGMGPQDALKYAATLRRQATVLGARLGAHPTVMAMLKDACSASGSDENTTTSSANTLAWLLLSSNEPSKALDVLEELYMRYRGRFLSAADIPVPVGMTAWNAGELALNFARATHQSRPRGFKRKRDNALREAKALFEMSGARPFRLRSDVEPLASLTEVRRELIPEPRPPLPSSLAANLEAVVRVAIKKAGIH